MLIFTLLINNHIHIYIYIHNRHTQVFISTGKQQIQTTKNQEIRPLRHSGLSIYTYTYAFSLFHYL